MSTVYDNSSTTSSERNSSQTYNIQNTSSRLKTLINKIQDESLCRMIQIEFEQLLSDQHQLLQSHQSRCRSLESETDEIKSAITDIQRRYEKAVREMQFFRKKYDSLVEQNQQWPSSPTYSDFSSKTSLYGSSDYLSRTHHEEPKRSFVSRNPSLSSSFSTPPSSLFSATTESSVSTVRTQHQSIVQQRKTDPLSFGGSDPFWDTITKGQDTTIEKIISNFIRRGGSPNTAKQSASKGPVKYGYGLIHTLIVTKSPISLDLLLQSGANPNAISMSQHEKVSPCYLAASVGWLLGMEKLILAGGDLISARGENNKTPLHVACEHGHGAMIEYITNVTDGVLNLETDNLGANALHYACISGNRDIIHFLVKVCRIPINDTDKKGETPIHWAVRHGRIEAVTVLVESYSADLNIYVPKKLGTAYDLAKSTGYKKLAEYIKQHGGLAAKKLDKRKDELLASQVPIHLESALAKNGFFMDGF